MTPEPFDPEEREMAPPWQQVPPVNSPVELAELEPITQALVHPLTGEAIDLATAPMDHIARFLDNIKEHERLLREAKSIVSEEVVRRMDTEACYTLRAGDFILKAPSPAPAEMWDELQLREDLWQLVDEGVISEAAAGRAVETVVDYKVRKAGVNALRKLGGRVEETVNRHCQKIEKPRYVSVSRP